MEKIKIKSIKRIEQETRYDLSVEKHNNFFANGILVHNCRCITIIEEDGSIKFFSREGKEFEVLSAMIQDVNSLGLTSMVLDGEICIVDENGIENFQEVMKYIRKKDYTIPNPKYKVFDILTLQDFLNKESKVIFSERQKLLKEVTKNYTGNKIDVLEQKQITCQEDFDLFMNEAREKNWEGLILRKNTNYKGKRSNDLLKVKDFFDAEYVVEDVVFSPMRFIIEGKEESVTCLSSVVITHKGYKVNVGSGFSFDDRIKYFKNPEKIIGSTITVQYFEETSNQEGGISLRFPTVKCIYEGVREV